MLRKYQTKQQWIEVCIILRACAPLLVAQGNSKHGMILLVAKRLGNFWTKMRPPGPDGVRKPNMFRIAVEDRGVFDVEAVEAAKPKDDLAAGDAVLCRGELARLAWYNESTGACGVAFTNGDLEEVIEYTSRYPIKGKPLAGCARLQRRQPSLMPPPQAQKSSALSDEVKEHVRATYESTCPTSPHSKDERKRRMVRHVVQVSKTPANRPPRHPRHPYRRPRRHYLRLGRPSRRLLRHHRPLRLTAASGAAVVAALAFAAPPAATYAAPPPLFGTLTTPTTRTAAPAAITSG